MIDMLRASLENAATVRTRDDALYYIGRRGGINQSLGREAKIRWA